MSKPNQHPQPKGGYAPASFAKLLAIAGEGSGDALRIQLTDIDEDPDQPRKAIDKDELELLAATIRSHGVLQPIGVHPAIDGRYRLAFGARRIRASRIAGQQDIPAVIVPETQRNYASQIIENQHRANLSNTDLAAAILQLYNDGMPIEQIVVTCSLKLYQVKAFRAVSHFPEFLTNRLNNGDIRALYDLYRQWTKTPAEIETAMPVDDSYLSITEARRIISAVNGKPPESSAAEKPNEPEAPRDPGEKKPKPAAAPLITVAIGDGEEGQLVFDRQPETAGWGVVRYATGIEEVELRQLRIVAIE